MERKTHILFTVVGIYGINLLLKKYNIDNNLSLWYIGIVSSFPLISIPYQVIVTTLPDADLHNSRLNKTILFPALSILSFFVKHRGFTHRIEGILFFSFLMFLLYLIGTNIIILGIISFLAITIIWVLIDDYKLSFLCMKIKKIGIGKLSIKIDPKIIDKILSLIILLFFPILLIPEIYAFFLISLILAYIFHMIGDAFSKEGLILVKIPFTKIRIKFQIPKSLAFRVGGFFERKIIKPILIILFFTIIIIDYKFWGDKILHDSILTYIQIKEIFINPELLFNDLNNINERFNNLKDFIKRIY